jgi:hypothetical protein
MLGPPLCHVQGQRTMVVQAKALAVAEVAKVTAERDRALARADQADSDRLAAEGVWAAKLRTSEQRADAAIAASRVEAQRTANEATEALKARHCRLVPCCCCGCC